MLYVLTFGSYVWAPVTQYGVATPPPAHTPPPAPRLIGRVERKEYSYRTLREAMKAAESVKKPVYSYDHRGRSRKPLSADVGVWLVKSARNVEKARLIAKFWQQTGFEVLMPEASRCDEHDDCLQSPSLAHACFLATSEALMMSELET